METKLPPLVGTSESFLEAVERVSALAPLDRPVLIVGEPGTGKELIAQRLHYLSPRWDEPLVTLCCPAVVATLMESELFGHEAGAFTGATRRHGGCFTRAGAGTLFLDELGEMATGMQQKLLRVLEYGDYTPVGGTQPLKARARVVAATNADLPALVAQGSFRRDLLDRLAFDVIALPPLRERTEDILTLADHFGTRMVAELRGDHFPGFNERAQERLLACPWPGNVRQLRSVVERAVVWAHHRGQLNRPLIGLRFNPFPPMATASGLERAGASAAGVSFEEQVEGFKEELVRGALEGAEHNQRRAAQALRLSYDQLRGLVRKYRISSVRRGRESGRSPQPPP